MDDDYANGKALSMRRVATLNAGTFSGIATSKILMARQKKNTLLRLKIQADTRLHLQAQTREGGPSIQLAQSQEKHTRTTVVIPEN